MAAQTETDVAALELEKVRDDLPVLFERSSTFYSQIEKKNVEVVSNRALRIPLEINPGGKPGHFSPAGGSLGLGAASTFDVATTTVQHLKYAVQWEKKAEWSTDNSRKAVLQSTRYALSKALAEFRRFLDCLWVGSNGTGVLGTITTRTNASSTDTYTLNTDGFRAKLLRYAQDIAVFNSDLTTNRTAGTDTAITFFDLAAKQVKVAQVTGSTNGDKIVVGGLGNVTGTSVLSINGVPYHNSAASTGTWQGLNRANVPAIRANAVDAASGTLALTFIRRALNLVGDRVGEENMKSLEAWTHPAQKQAYEQLGQLVSVINKQAKEEGLELFFGDGMQMAGVPIKTHYAWDRTRIDFLAKDVFGRSEMHPLDYYEVDGKKIFEIRDSDGSVKTSNLYYLTLSTQAFVSNPAVLAAITSLAVPTGY